MKPIITLSLSTLFTLNAMATEASTFSEVFSNADFSAELRLLYSNIDEKNTQDSYATAIGGELKYELATFNGFGGGIALNTTNDIDTLTGDGQKYNSNLSTKDGSYSELTQAYLEYSSKNFSLRAGRQTLDTPLADSDDIRMVPNRFEAIVASYNVEDLTFIFADVLRWNGVDAGLEKGWSKTGEDGTYTFAFIYEKETLNLSAWYYDVTKIASAYYLEASETLPLKAIEFTLGIQYLNQKEENNSGIKASIYGLVAEAYSKGITLSLAYNSSARQKGKTSFSGFGGGTLFSSMDTMILDEITQNAQAKAYLASLSYEINNFNLFYTYGDFRTKENKQVTKKHIIEQNIGIEYIPNDALTLSTIFIKDTNKEDSKTAEFNANNIRFLATYSF